MHVACIVLSLCNFVFFPLVALAATAVIGIVDSGGGGYLLKSARARRQNSPQQPAEGKSNEAFDEKL